MRILSKILSVLLIFTLISSTTYNTVTITVPYGKGHVLNIYFKALGYGYLRTSLEVSLGNETTIKLYLNELTRPLSGIYLFNNSIIKAKHIMLSPNVWYDLVLNYTHSNLCIYLKTLNRSYIANVFITSTLYTQGLTFSGKYWFFTGTTSIYKLGKDMNKIIKYNEKPIPKFLKRERYFHLGDLDYYNGKLLIPIEKTNYVKPAIIALYDSYELKLIGYSYTPQDHMPWIAVDTKGFIYTSEYSPVSEVYVYHINQIGMGNYIHPIKVIKLSKELRDIQGGVVIDDKVLALTSDDGDHIYLINITTGKVIEEVRIPGLYEIEGIEAIKINNETNLFVLVNTHEYDNIIYQYKLIDKGEVINLFNLTCKPYSTVKITYDKNTIYLGNMLLTTYTPQVETFKVKEYQKYFMFLIISIIIIIAIAVTTKLKVKS